LRRALALTPLVCSGGVLAQTPGAVPPPGEPASAARPGSAASTPAEPVVVTATRTEKALAAAPLRTEVVTSDEIRRMNARTLAQALENVPGLQLREVHGKSGFSVQLQGLSSDQVLVLVDGLPISSSTGSTTDVSQYLVATVDHIEIVKGAASAQYGSSAMGGVINVITRRIEPGLRATATGDVGSYADQNASGKAWKPGTWHVQGLAEGGSEAWRWRVAADVADSDGFAVDPQAWALQGDVVRREQYFGSLRWLPRTDVELWLDAGQYRETDEQRYDLFVPPNTLPQGKTEEIVRDRVAGGATWLLADGTRLLIKGVDERYHSRTQEASNAIVFGERTAEQHMDHVTAQVDLPAWRDNLLQFGVDWHAETLSQSANGVAEIVGTGRAQRSTTEAFVQDDILFGSRWELLLGLRVQQDSDFGFHAAPKVGVRGTFDIDADWYAVLRAAYGQGYRVPNLKERYFVFDHSALGYMVLGNPDLKPESSNSFQLGGQFVWRDQLTLDINAFYNDLDDLIQTDLASPDIVSGIAVYTYENIGRARTAGVETGARWQPSAQWLVEGAYTYTDTRDLDTGQELTRRPRNMGVIGLNWNPSAATRVSLRGRYQGSELIDTATGTRSPAWATLDVTLNQQLAPGVVAFAGINNLFDRQRNFDDPADFGPVAGRYFQIGLRVAIGD